jgi:hypothetical protein
MRSEPGKRPVFICRYNKIEQNQSRIENAGRTSVLSETHCPSRFGVELLRDLVIMRNARQIETMHQELEAESRLFQALVPGKTGIPKNFFLKGARRTIHQLIHAAFFQTFQPVFN